MCLDKKGDIVKLYDLTSLTNDEQSHQNPFRHPLAHLLFRVALKLHKKDSHANSGVIQALLTNSLALAPEARPQVRSTLTRVFSRLHPWFLLRIMAVTAVTAKLLQYFVFHDQSLE